MKKLFLITATFVALAPAIAFAAESPCDELLRAVEFNVKEIAYYDVSPSGETDMQATSRNLEKVYEASRLQSNLLLMQANRCQLPRSPIDPRKYFESAFGCRHAAPKPGASYKEPIPECDREKWARAK